MSKVIALLSSDKKGGATTIAFNLANFLKGEDKKVLIINNEFESSYTNILDLKGQDIKSTNTIYPLTLAKYKKNVQILFLKNPFVKLNNLKLDYLKILTAQAAQWKDLFDYVIFDTNYTWKKLSDIALHFADSVVAVYDTNNYSITDLTNSMKHIRASQLVNAKLKLRCVILNNFSRENNHHLATLLSIDKILYKQQSVITLPFVNELVEVSDKSLSYTNNVQWSDYAIEIDKIAQLLKA